MKNNIELLAPAGTYEAFIAAVENGADAVYLGGKLFNARANASNFDLSELEKIVQYAHLRNVKIYLTLNTLLDNEEIKEALDFAYDIYSIGIDAVIVQDIGLATILNKYIPNLHLHASTQMTVYNLDGVKELEKIGFKRVVLARELSLDEIKYICDNTNVEIETFIHGALCVSYSGQCLMSSMIGDRSGNRGKCAQPCRLPYELIENNKSIAKGYLLSPKDLCTLDLLNVYPNVSSLKIEGRMKSPEYVATVVKTYRKYIDEVLSASFSNVSKEDKNNLVQIFNRGGFTDAYLNKKQGQSMMSFEKPKNWGTYVGKVTNYDGHKYITLDNVTNISMGDGIEVWNNERESPSTIVSEIIGNKIGRIHGNINIGDKVYKTSDKLLNQQARETYSRGFVKRVPIDVNILVKKDVPITIRINDFSYTSNIIPELASNQPITRDKFKTQFEKTGDTPFYINAFNLELDDNLFLPVSIINQIRRESLDGYTKLLISNMKKDITKFTLNELTNSRKTYTENKAVSVNLLKLRDEHLKIENADNIYFSFKDALLKKDLISKFKAKKYIILPTVTKSTYDKLIKQNISKLASIVDGFVISNIGQLEYVKELGKEIIANYTFNIFNTYSSEFIKSLGINTLILSPELTKNQINNINSDINKQIVVYGRQCVMTSEYCPVGSFAGNFTENSKCSMPCTKNNVYYLRDRMNMDFLVIPDNVTCSSSIYNCKITSIESKGINVDSIRLDFINESIDEINNIIKTHKSGEKLSGDDYTNGHINRPV